MEFMTDTVSAIKPANRPAKMNGGYLFLPHALSRGAFLKWLRRTHAWFGLWGAALGLLFGFTGILLNHREVLKIPLGKMQATEIQMALPQPYPADAKALAEWLGQTLAMDLQQAKVRNEPSKTVIWNNTTYQQPALWQITLRNPKRSFQAEYWQGNAFVLVKQGESNVLQMLSNLHKGGGMGVAWVLLVDTLGGGLILLSLTGTLLWTRLHGSRLAAAGLGLGSMGMVIVLAVQAMAG
jgi:uncharacterized protein